MARTQLSVANFNLYNLNEPGMPMYGDTGGWSQEEYDLKVAWTARVLAEMPADVWGFQELWHADSLRGAFKAANRSADYTLLAPPGHAGQRIVCAAAVRKNILIGDPEWIEAFPDGFRLEASGDDAQTPDIAVRIDAFSRPVLHFEIKPRASGKRIHVYVCHFKSKRPTGIWREPWYRKATHSKHAEAIGGALSTVRRTAEATALRMILTERLKGNDTPVIVLGDTNDGHRSNTLNVLSGQPNYITSGLTLGGSDTDLYNVGLLQNYRSFRDVYYTHVYNNTMESLDNILVSEQFYDNSRKRLWAFKGMDIRNDHLNEHDHKQHGTGDHGIVRARFEYRPAR